MGAEARCAAERALIALEDMAPGPSPRVRPPNSESHAPSPPRLVLPGIPGAPSKFGKKLPPAPPPPGEPPRFAFTRPEECACRFRFNCSCRKFRGAEVNSSRPPTRDFNSTAEEDAGNPTTRTDIDWEAPCLDCGHARMYHRRIASGG